MVRCWAQIIFFVVIVALGTVSMLSGCGQKGPLYLPDEAHDAPTEQSESKER